MQIFGRTTTTRMIVGVPQGGNMSIGTQAITAAVVAAVSKASLEKSIEAAHGSEALQRLDSLGLMIAFADIQATLGLRFEPEHLMQLFLCPSIEEMVIGISKSTDSG